MAELFDSKYFRGQGKLFIGDREADGSPSNLIFVGDLSSADLTPAIERDEIIENVSGSSGVGASWLRGVKFNLSIAMRSVKPEHLAIALQGAATKKSAGSVEDESHKVKIGAFSRLLHTNVSSVVVEKSDSPVSAAGNFVIHADEGMIEWLTGASGISDGDTVTISYSYAAQAHVTSNPGNAAKYIVFAGINTANDDKQTRCEIYKVKLDPGALALITDSASDMTLNGVIEQDTLRSAGDQFFSWKVET